VRRGDSHPTPGLQAEHAALVATGSISMTVAVAVTVSVAGSTSYKAVSTWSVNMNTSPSTYGSDDVAGEGDGLRD
jgi:hypothetical protein